jgi:hypothetical protein
MGYSTTTGTVPLPTITRPTKNIGGSPRTVAHQAGPDVMIGHSILHDILL